MTLAHSTQSAPSRPGITQQMMRAVLLLFALVTLGGTILTAPQLFQDLQTVCLEASCQDDLSALLPSGVELLQRAGLSSATYGYMMTALFIVETVISCSVVALIVLRSREPIAFLVSAAILLIGGQTFFGWRQDPGWFLITATHNYLLFATLVLAFYLFPNGRFVPRWSRWMALALLVTEFFYSYFPEAAFSPHNFFPPLETAIWFGALLLIPLSQIYRYVAVSSRVERQQTKWVVGGIVVALGSLLIAVQLNVILPPELYDLGRLLAQPILTAGLMAIPISFAVAILRYRLWDIDLIVRRTLVYGALTAMLAFVYFGSVVLLQNLFNALSGQGSQAAIVLSTLAIAALFAPLRRRIQQFIDLRFYRRRYNAQKTLERFARTTRDEVELESLAQALLGAVSESLQPASVALWLKPAPDAHVYRRTS